MIPQDILIQILMYMEPKQRTIFLRTSPIPGLKTKLRKYANFMYPIDASQDVKTILNQLTLLMKHGGIPSKDILEICDLLIENNNILWNNSHQMIITNFLKMYFDCGFIYHYILNKFIQNVDRKYFRLYKEIYQQVYRIDNDPIDTIDELYIIDSFTTSDTQRFLIFDEWIIYQHITPIEIAEHIWFDYHKNQIDTEAIFNYLIYSLEDSSIDFFPYILSILDYPFENHFEDGALNIYLSKFFKKLISDAIYNNKKFRVLVDKLEKYSFYFLDNLLKKIKQLELLCHKNDENQEKIDWLNEKIVYIIQNRPDDIQKSYFIKKRPEMLHLLK